METASAPLGVAGSPQHAYDPTCHRPRFRSRLEESTVLLDSEGIPKWGRRRELLECVLSSSPFCGPMTVQNIENFLVGYPCVKITFRDLKRDFLQILQHLKSYKSNLGKKFMKGFHMFCITWISLLLVRKEPFQPEIFSILLTASDWLEEQGEKTFLKLNIIQWKGISAVRPSTDFEIKSMEFTAKYNPFSYWSKLLSETSANEVANAITFFQNKLFLAIRAKHFMATDPCEREEITKVADFFNGLSNWVMCFILYSLPDQIPEKICKVIHIVVALHKNNDFNGLLAMVSALSNPAVSRLSKFWKLVPPKTLTKMKDVEEIVSPIRGHAAYREIVENLEEPCIPLLAVHLGDLTHTFDSSWKSKKIGQEEKDQLADSLPKPSSTKKTKNRPKSEISGCGKVIRLRSEQELGKPDECSRSGKKSKRTIVSRMTSPKANNSKEGKKLKKKKSHGRHRSNSVKMVPPEKVSYRTQSEALQGSSRNSRLSPTSSPENVNFCSLSSENSSRTTSPVIARFRTADMDELDQPFEDGATAIEGSLGHEFQKTWQEALLDFNAPSSISPTDCVEETDPEKIKGAKPHLSKTLRRKSMGVTSFKSKISRVSSHGHSQLSNTVIAQSPDSRIGRGEKGTTSLQHKRRSPVDHLTVTIHAQNSVYNEKIIDSSKQGRQGQTSNSGAVSARSPPTTTMESEENLNVKAFKSLSPGRAMATGRGTVPDRGVSMYYPSSPKTGDGSISPELIADIKETGIERKVVSPRENTILRLARVPSGSEARLGTDTPMTPRGEHTATGCIVVACRSPKEMDSPVQGSPHGSPALRKSSMRILRKRTGLSESGSFSFSLSCKGGELFPPTASDFMLPRNSLSEFQLAANHCSSPESVKETDLTKSSNNNSSRDASSSGSSSDSPRQAVAPDPQQERDNGNCDHDRSTKHAETEGADEDETEEEDIVLYNMDLILTAGHCINSFFNAFKNGVTLPPPPEPVLQALHYLPAMDPEHLYQKSLKIQPATTASITESASKADLSSSGRSSSLTTSSTLTSCKDVKATVSRSRLASPFATWTKASMKELLSKFSVPNSAIEIICGWDRHALHMISDDDLKDAGIEPVQLRSHILSVLATVRTQWEWEMLMKESEQ